ncbi:hypothetical protein [Methylophilus sp. Leaf414]|uniref:hypothetical protein n=1 Tax=Methylophilus sp. Leaf414 TaxID=1736371 RepID=UPI0006FE0BF9|nr:hypothetical protein [Methylophilus sp. Leaf414]KQT38043.1 hypothetical protein ASG24_03470 [Methylophilus sp. Leaf414]
MIKNVAMGIVFLTTSALAYADGVAVSIGQPGFYGQIVLGDPYPAPQVVYAQPVIIQPPPVAVVQPPMYLRVPPGQMKKWSRYCGHYGACGRQVYFVQDSWYQNVYAPRYVSYSHDHGDYRGDRDDHHHEHYDKKGRGPRHDDRVPGNGKGRGNGNGNSKGRD